MRKNLNEFIIFLFTLGYSGCYTLTQDKNLSSKDSILSSKDSILIIRSEMYV